MPRMIVDCDPGHDDAIALILAHEYAEVVGVTTVAGNAPLSATTTNALLMMVLLGVDTPVYSGASEALAGPAPHAQAAKQHLSLCADVIAPFCPLFSADAGRL